jgi:cell division transport system ATP-binding protein
MIYFDKVSKIYSDDCEALIDVTLTIEPKEFVSIVGHSGAGKSTLIKMILAEEKPTTGKVFYESSNVHKL